MPALIGIGVGPSQWFPPSWNPGPTMHIKSHLQLLLPLSITFHSCSVKLTEKEGRIRDIQLTFAQRIRAPGGYILTEGRGDLEWSAIWSYCNTIWVSAGDSLPKWKDGWTLVALIIHTLKTALLTTTSVPDTSRFQPAGLLAIRGLGCRHKLGWGTLPGKPQVWRVLYGREMKLGSLSTSRAGALLPHVKD